jgi:hypothetical protein
MLYGIQFPLVFKGLIQILRHSAEQSVKQLEKPHKTLTYVRLCNRFVKIPVAVPIVTC